MQTNQPLGKYQPDPAAVFAVAMSLWEECHRLTSTKPDFNLSDTFSGMDGLMRNVMRIAELFESWACTHVNFDRLTDVWPYILQDRFGKECLSVLTLENISEFDRHDCARVAARLGLPFQP